jgi:hypothetical protein
LLLRPRHRFPANSVEQIPPTQIVIGSAILITFSFFSLRGYQIQTLLPLRKVPGRMHQNSGAKVPQRGPQVPQQHPPHTGRDRQIPVPLLLHLRRPAGL